MTNDVTSRSDHPHPKWRRLFVRAQSGCTESLGTLLEDHRTYLGLIARVRLEQDLQSKCSPSDVVQETFVRAHQFFDDFAGASQPEFTAWLRKILASQIATQIRHYSTRRRDVHLERRIDLDLKQSSLLLNGMLADAGASPSRSAEDLEQTVLLADALTSLPGDYREVIVLRHLQGYRFAEIAEKMNRSVDTVKAIWRRAIGQLRDQFSDEAM